MQSLLLSTTTVLPFGIAIMFASIFGIIVVGVVTAFSLFGKGVPNKVKKLLIGISIIAVLVLIMLASSEYYKAVNQASPDSDIPKWLFFILLSLDIISVTMYFGLTTDKKE